MDQQKLIDLITKSNVPLIQEYTGNPLYDLLNTTGTEIGEKIAQAQLGAQDMLDDFMDGPGKAYDDPYYKNPVFEQGLANQIIRDGEELDILADEALIERGPMTDAPKHHLEDYTKPQNMTADELIASISDTSGIPGSSRQSDFNPITELLSNLLGGAWDNITGTASNLGNILGEGAAKAHLGLQDQVKDFADETRRINTSQSLKGKQNNVSGSDLLGALIDKAQGWAYGLGGDVADTLGLDDVEKFMREGETDNIAEAKRIEDMYGGTPDYSLIDAGQDKLANLLYGTGSGLADMLGMNNLSDSLFDDAEAARLAEQRASFIPPREYNENDLLSDLNYQSNTGSLGERAARVLNDLVN